MKTYLALLSMFGSLSLLSIGGGNTVLPDMHLQAVTGHHWLTNSQFADIFSISQAAPGPSILIVALVGYAAGLGTAGVIGGIVGGVLATVAMIVPAATLMYLITVSWQKAEKSKLRLAVQKGFAPLTVGLIMASSLVMSRAADHDWRAYLITAVATVIFLRTNTNPLIVVGAAALLGYIGFV
ncbi:chromate transporter [Mycolicibacterium litorale]|nr:chromate transporter [Mycolicibacterium litorale]